MTIVPHYSSPQKSSGPLKRKRDNSNSALLTHTPHALLAKPHIQIATPQHQLPNPSTLDEAEDEKG
jgi:hypothetical protein